MERQSANAALPLYEAEAARNIGGRPPKPTSGRHELGTKAAKSTDASARATAQFKRVVEQAPDTPTP